MTDLGEGLSGEAIERAAFGVAVDLIIEACRVERLEPAAESRELIGRQRGDGLFEVFNGHGENIALESQFVMVGPSSPHPDATRERAWGVCGLELRRVWGAVNQGHIGKNAPK